MASTNKTPKLGLNQWVGTDQFMREDFNGDNAKIDTQLALAVDYMRLGDFVGNGVPNREINVGFRPRLVILFGVGIANTPAIIFLYPAYVTEVQTSFTATNSCSKNNLEITERGFLINEKAYGNQQGQPAHYIAFR